MEKKNSNVNCWATVNTHNQVVVGKWTTHCSCISVCFSRFSLPSSGKQKPMTLMRMFIWYNFVAYHRSLLDLCSRFSHWCCRRRPLKTSKMATCYCRWKTSYDKAHHQPCTRLRSWFNSATALDDRTPCAERPKSKLLLYRYIINNLITIYNNEYPTHNQYNLIIVIIMYYYLSLYQLITIDSRIQQQWSGVVVVVVAVTCLRFTHRFNKH